ncbi:hypothetical protein CD006_08255 [Enterobacter sp. 10-1]|uniref:hypothetical protein n=1 Tax=Raoultella sp. 10-1 TaxID=2683201 RepID=UPI000BA2FF7D|nr:MULTISPECIES: hypothetical protein [Enterobacteriaceae]MVT02656.1 hypothetical protein [Raoultella sp. 10-1]PAC12071.1 hypothetical protein CD006_08255 [Enterobacter sp. 10-1]
MTTATESQCTDWGNTIRSQVEKFYGHQLSEAEKMKQEAIAQGLDPANVQVEGIATINYLKLIEDTNVAKNAALHEAERRVAQCLTEAAPEWINDIQKVTDCAMAIAILPYVLLTNNYAAEKIDLNEIYKGRTFGGDDAVIPKIRDDVLSTLQISGDVAKIISDPVNTTRKVIDDIINNIPVPKITFPPIVIDWPHW